MFESVHGSTDGRLLESHPISSPGAFGLGELKITEFRVTGLKILGSLGTHIFFF